MSSRVLSKLLMLIAPVFFTTYLYAQDSTSVDTLVAYYPFNGNASDSSGFGNDGQVFGASLTEDRFGNPNSAYSFDGISDFIEILDDSTFTSPTKTVEFWFNKTNSFIDESVGFAEGLIWKSFDTDANRDFSFQIRNKLPPFDIYNAVSNGSVASVYTEVSNFIESTTWYHVVGVIDTSSNSLYINGQHIVTEEHDGEVINHGAPISIGRSSSSSLSNRYFRGKIDDIKIYNYALNESAILDSYSIGGWPISEEVIPDTLVAHYPFNGNASDSSGFGNDGQVFGPLLAEDRFGNLNSAYAFDGFNDYIEIPDDLEFTSATKTIEFWFNKTDDPTKTTGDGLIWKSFGTSAIRDYSFMLTREEGSFGFYNAVSNGSDASVYTWMDNPIYADRWYHVVGIVDTSSNSLYVNGEHVVTVQHDGEVINHGAPITIGKASVNSLSTRFFKGSIDDIKIYNYVLSDSAIIASFTEGDWPLPPPPIDSTGTVADTLIAYYPFDGNAIDSSGFNNNGIVFGTELTEDRFDRMNSAYYFDGSDYIDFGSSDTIEFAREDFSISVWVKPTSSGKSQYQILRKGSDFVTDGEARWSLALDELGKIRMIFEDADQGDSTLVVYGEKSLLDDKWHHIGVVFDRDSTLRVFIDNEEEISSEDIKGYSGYITNQEDFSMYAGRGNSGASQFSFAGAMDDIRIYSYALEDSAIGNLYSEDGWPVVIPDTLVAYYPFNGNAADSSGFGSDGQIFGASLTGDRFGNPSSAYSFDGDNDYINTNTSFDFPERSVSIWVKPNVVIDSVFNHQIVLNQDSDLLENGAFGISMISGIFRFKEGNTEEPWEQEIEEDNWYHLTMVRKDTSVYGYINGELIGVGLADNNSSMSNPNETLLIGTSRLFDRNFDGLIDDIRIYNYAISDSSIADLYTEGGWPPPPSPIDSTGTVADTLIAYYPFDTNALDLSNFDNDGIVFGAELTEDRFGRTDSAYYFDGSDYIDFGSSDTIEFAREDFSISVWIKPTSSGKSQYQILRKGSDFVTNGEARWSLALDELGKIRMIFEDADQGDSTLVVYGEKSLLDDKWHHIGVVFDRDSTLRVYVDNQVEINSEKIVGYSGYITNQEDFSMYAGRGNSGASQFSFVGAMDDIRIYSYALEDSVIRHLYSEGGWPIDSTGTFNEGNIYIPEEYLLYQNFPNPFNPSTTIKFDLAETGLVSLKVFDITGRLVINLVNETKTAGQYQVSFDASNLASGIYLYELRTDKFSSIKKFTLIK